MKRFTFWGDFNQPVSNFVKLLTISSCAYCDQLPNTMQVDETHIFSSAKTSNYHRKMYGFSLWCCS